MKLALLCLLLVVVAKPLAALPAADAPGSPEDAKLAAFFKSWLDDHFRRHPFDATRAGDHRYDDRLEDLSPEARAADRAAVAKTLAALPQQVDYQKLTRAGQIDYEILHHDLTYRLWKDENENPFANDPRVYNEYAADSVFLLLTQSSLPKEQNVRNAAARMSFIPAVIKAAKAALKNPPRAILETAIRQNKGSIGFYEGGIFAIAGETPQLSPLAAPARTAAAALKEYQEYLEKELLPRSTGDWRLGKDKFYRKIELELDSGLNADEVLAAAEAEAERVEREMVVIARQLWAKEFPGKPVPPDDPPGRRELVRGVFAILAHNHGQPDHLVEDAKTTVERIKTFIRENDIVRLPDPDRCRVIEMPEFQRGNSVAYLNPAPPLDPHAESMYAVAPPPRDWDTRKVESYLAEYNRPMLQILSIHEGYPGHYVQLEYSNRFPSLIRKVLYNGTFAEGWAVYTEQMMLDQGYGGGDLSLRLHQLKFYQRTVINAVLDHKMHCSQMTDDEAMDLLVNRGFQSEGEARLKVIRSKQSSTQLSTYFVGRTAFYRLRQAVQREQGDKFDLGRYHEAVLANGTPPVKYLPELTRERLKQLR
ncbi:MAG TPA: DUF885 domain-containing protein [Gemmataceae bacterium]|nr:DUF885 domain-containing protein [Gemmataceae bacterium]